MRRYTALLTAILLWTGLHAQEPIYILNDFQQGRITMKPHIDAGVRLNIDACGQKIFYYDRDILMELENPDRIDTVFVSGRKFVWKNGCLCEMMHLDGGDVYVNWKLRESFVGKEGAMGITTQGKAETYYVPGLNSKSSLESRARYRDETEVYKVNNENIYWFTVSGREYKVRRPKDLYNAFPAHQERLKAFIREHNLVMTDTQDALRIIGYLLSVTQE